MSGKVGRDISPFTPLHWVGKCFRVAKLERQMRRNGLSCSSTQILASFIGQKLGINIEARRIDFIWWVWNKAVVVQS
jgi:hypothetical protein